MRLEDQQANLSIDNKGLFTVGNTWEGRNNLVLASDSLLKLVELLISLHHYGQQGPVTIIW